MLLHGHSSTSLPDPASVTRPPLASLACLPGSASDHVRVQIVDDSAVKAALAEGDAGRAALHDFLAEQNLEAFAPSIQEEGYIFLSDLVHADPAEACL